MAARCRFHVVVLVDPRAPWNELRRALDECEDLPPDVVVIADRKQAQTAIEALRDGVTDVLLRPFPSSELIAAIGGSGGERGVAKTARPAMADDRTLIGDSPAIRAVRDLVERVAPTPATVLIAGEIGTRRARVARLLHEQSGLQGPFVPVDCGAVAPELLASELFGHSRPDPDRNGGRRDGVFVAARGGTLFLDDISELRPDLQVRLLRTLDENTYRPVGSDREVAVDCRIIAATRVDLRDLVAQGRFRADLCYRLDTIRIELPPLRERRSDIPSLATDILERVSTMMGLARVDLDAALLDELQAHDWPGNERELQNVIERLLLVGRLPDDLSTATPDREVASNYPLDWTLEQVKHHHMLRVLEATGGNKSAAARRLKVSRKTLERKLGPSGRESGRQ